jgi:hypothetical protein
VLTPGRPQRRRAAKKNGGEIEMRSALMSSSDRSRMGLTNDNG